MQLGAKASGNKLLSFALPPPFMLVFPLTKGTHVSQDIWLFQGPPSKSAFLSVLNRLG